MPAARQYEVRIAFDRVDRKTGDSRRFEPGEPYSGGDIDLYLVGVDDQGPLIAEKADPKSSASSKEN